MAHPVDEFAVQQPKESDGTKPKSTTKKDLEADIAKHIIQEKINQETKRIKIPPLQLMDKAVNTPVVAQRQVSQVHVVAETAETPQLQVADKMVDVPAVFVSLVAQVQVVGKTVQIPQLPLVEKIAAEIQTALGTQTSENLNGEFDAGHDEKSGQVDAERVRQHTGAAAWQRQPHSIKQQPTEQTAQERGGEKKMRGQVEKEKGQGERKRKGRKRTHNQNYM